MNVKTRLDDESTDHVAGPASQNCRFMDSSNHGDGRSVDPLEGKYYRNEGQRTQDDEMLNWGMKKEGPAPFHRP